MPAPPDPSVEDTRPASIGQAVRGGSGRIKLRTLILIRWLAVAGQGIAILFVHFAMQLPVPLPAALAVVAVSALVNLYLMARYPPGSALNERSASIQLAYDTLQLAVLLYITGGIANPFSLFMLAPLTISATILSRRATFLLLLLSLSLSLALVFVHEPLPWADEGPDIPRLYHWGMWGALAIGMTFLAYYASRVAEDARQRADALAATEAALAHEHKLSAVGGLAAAAAHELGTPLGTILVTAREMRDRWGEADGDLAADIDLLVGEAERSRAILQKLSRPSHSPRPDHPVTLESLVHRALDPLPTGHITMDIAAEGEGPVPMAADRAEIIYGLRNFIENAAGFARRTVCVTLSWSEDSAMIAISDDGPGFDPSIEKHLGEPYISKHFEEDGIHGLGLGIFIAKTLLERTGAGVSFGRSDLGGAEVQIAWKRTGHGARQGKGDNPHMDAPRKKK